jgi:hypothetical protein
MSDDKGASSKDNKDDFTLLNEDYRISLLYEDVEISMLPNLGDERDLRVMIEECKAKAAISFKYWAFTQRTHICSRLTAAYIKFLLHTFLFCIHSYVLEFQGM